MYFVKHNTHTKLLNDVTKIDVTRDSDIVLPHPNGSHPKDIFHPLILK